MTTPAIFLSAASDDLKDWRDILHKAFSRAGYMVFTQNQSLGASAGDVLRLLRQHLDKSDFVIHLAGLAYGAEPEQPTFADHADFKCSYTQFEYYYAHQTGRPVIAFVCGPHFPYLSFTEKAKDDADRERRRTLQLAHRERVANGRFTGTPLDGHAIRPLSETVGDVGTLLQAVAAAIGTIRDSSPTRLASVQTELRELATRRHDELLAYIADLPTRVADELERRRLIKPALELKVDVSRIDKYAPAELIGREAETKLYTSVRPPTKATNPPSKTYNRFTKQWSTAVRRRCSRRRVPRFTRIASSAGKVTACSPSAHSGPTWEPSPASSSNHGATSRPRSRKPTTPGCCTKPPSASGPWAD